MSTRSLTGNAILPWQCYTASNLALAHKKQNLKTCTIKNLFDNENINLKMPSLLWQGNLPNRASKINRLLASHDIHLPRACKCYVTPLLKAINEHVEGENEKEM